VLGFDITDEANPWVIMAVAAAFISLREWRAGMGQYKYDGPVSGHRRECYYGFGSFLLAL